LENKNIIFKKIIIISIFLISCNSILFVKKNKNIAVVEIKNLVIDSFKNENIDVLKRYFLGNPSWNYCEERGKIYAIKKELIDTILQNKIIVSFDNYLAYKDFDKTTFANSRNGTKKLFTFTDSYFQNEFASYLVIEGKNINIEIFEISKTLNRKFSQEVINDLNIELKTVLQNKESILINGKMFETKYYPINYDSAFFEICNNIDSGKYTLKAAYNFTEEGKVYAKVYATKNNYQLSKKQITPISTKSIGWSETGSQYFYYESEITILEGAFATPYNASFELWFVNKNGIETKIFEKQKIIKGWNRKP